MSYVWEEDYDVLSNGVPTITRTTWHLKKLIPADPLSRPPWRLGTGPYKVSLAWINRDSERKYTVRTLNRDDDKTFRSLKAAKAYALAIATLET